MSRTSRRIVCTDSSQRQGTDNTTTFLYKRKKQEPHRDSCLNCYLCIYLITQHSQLFHCLAAEDEDDAHRAHLFHHA